MKNDYICTSCAYRTTNGGSDSPCHACRWNACPLFGAPEQKVDNWFGAPHLDVRPKGEFKP